MDQVNVRLERHACCCMEVHVGPITSRAGPGILRSLPRLSRPFINNAFWRSGVDQSTRIRSAGKKLPCLNSRAFMIMSITVSISSASVLYFFAPA